MRRSTANVLAILIALVSALPAQALTTAWQSKVDASVLNAAQSGKTDFIVYMDAKADLAPAALLASKQAKGTFVFEALTETARTSQADVVSLLRGLGAPTQSFWISNTVVTKGGLDVIQAVAQRADVKAIHAVGRGELHWPVDVPGGGTASVDGTDSANLTTTVGPSIDWVDANDAWALGHRGQGAVVAGADTGVRWTHDAIKRQYRGWDAATGSAAHDYNWHNAAGPNASCPADETQPCDDNDHGTHTVGTIVGDDGAGNQIGMAPDAKWIACRNMNQGFGVVPTYMDCMQWFIAPTDLNGNNPDPSKAPDVVNNSWGCVEACAPPLLKDMIDASRAAGIFYAVSAGNDNQFFFGLTMACNTINFPLAVYNSAFTVGASDAAGNGVPTDEIADYSSLGPVSDNPSEGILYRKPDIVAPGTNVRSATSGADDSYASLSGTSMAGPHVAGLVALIISANPALRGDVDTIEDIIRSTAKPLTSDLGCGGDSDTQVPNNVFGWGRINALAAVQRAAAMARPDLTVSAMSANDQKPKEGDPVIIKVTVSNVGTGNAGASRLELTLEDGSLLGALDTPALAAGGSATLTQGWNTRGVNGQHVIDATADAGGVVAESNESNNVGRLTVEIRGNKVKNSSFEESDSSGSQPADWQSSSTSAGQTSWSENPGASAEDNRGATISGTGGNALLGGVPTWTSAPVAVTPGELLTLTVDVSTSSMSSAPSVSLAYLGSADQLLSTAKLLTAPLSTSGTYATLSQSIAVPANVTSLRIVLAGFAPTDTRTAGKVTFDRVGLYGQ